MALRNLILMGVLLVACDRTVAPTANFEPVRDAGAQTLYVVASDFTTGAVYRVDLAAGKVAETVLPAHADATARFSRGLDRLLVLNRLAGSHLTLASSDLTQVLGQIALPAAGNPQDVLPLDANQAWLSFLKAKSVQKWDLATGKVLAEVDLSEWADADGYAEATYWYRTEGTAWVALERLDNRTFVAAGAGYILPIDLATSTVDRARIVTLERGNPFTEIKPVGERLCIGAAGVLDRQTPNLDGAVECWSPAGGAVQSLVNEQVLGGEVLDFDALSSGAGLAITGTPRTDLVFFDGAGARTLVAGEGFQFSHIFADPVRQVWYVADRASQKPGIRVFGWDGTEKGHIPLPLPPFRIVGGR